MAFNFCIYSYKIQITDYQLRSVKIKFNMSVADLLWTRNIWQFDIYRQSYWQFTN